MAISWYGSGHQMRLRNGDPCPRCGKPLMLVSGRSLMTLFRRCLWLLCQGAPKCGFATRLRQGGHANDA